MSLNPPKQRFCGQQQKHDVHKYTYRDQTTGNLVLCECAGHS